MDRRIHKPGVPLSQYVEFIWQQVASSGAPSSRQRVYPDGAMALVIHLNRPTATYFMGNETSCVRVPVLAGPFSRSFQFDPSQSTAVVGIAFRPGAARMFFPIAAHELHNTDIALSELCSCEADRLLNDVGSAANQQSQVLVVEQYLMRKLTNAAPIHPAVRRAVEQVSRNGGVRSVRKIQLDSGLSHTRFIHLFREHVGLTPKLFCRVRRFHGLLNQIKKGIPVNWAELAIDCGYFDQAHLIRDFRAFAGTTPLEYSRTMPDADQRFVAAVAES